MKTQITNNNVYTLDLTYSKRDDQVDWIIRKIQSYKKARSSNITIVREKINLWWFGPFKCVSNRLLVTFDNSRHLKSIIESLWRKYNSNVNCYDIDLFQLF